MKHASHSAVIKLFEAAVMSLEAARTLSSRTSLNDQADDVVAIFRKNRTFMEDVVAAMTATQLSELPAQ